jgi:outer membrane protein assembly factor BamB
VAGINKVAALSEVDGKILWTKEIASIPSSAPVSDGKFVYVSSNDNKTYALDAATGDLTWVQSGIVRTTAIFGFANPVILKDLLIVSYSSGEIYALKKSSGEAIWSQDLNLSKATTSDFYLNDVDATPIVKNDVIYAIGNGGLMMAVKVKDGNYLWKKEIAGLTDFWLAGDFLFVINNDNKLLAVSKKTGGIKWISQLPNLAKEKKPQTKFIYSGVVMAGDKLLISRLDGALLIASPLDGTLEKTFKINKKISHAPAVVDGKIYLQAIGKYVIDLLEIE